MELKIVLIGIAIGLLAVILLSLPRILNRLGLHPRFIQASYHLSGKRALIIATSHDQLGDTGKPTGVFASEMTVPYYEFLDAGMTVDVASIKGGKVPLEPISVKWPVATPADRRFRIDPEFLAKVEHSLPINAVDFTKYDLVYMAGGWGAAYDLGQSDELGQKISSAYQAGAILGSVCHGALGFLKALGPDGAPLVKGRRMTAVTDKQVRELGIGITPLHPETELRHLGAKFESQTSFRDIFANHVVVEHRLVTGQNQNAGGETAQEMMKILAESQTDAPSASGR